MTTFPLPQPVEETVAIVGVGLIGGSLAAALKERHAARRVLGVGRSLERLKGAQSAGLIDCCFTDIETAAREAQLVVVCTPVDRIADDVRQAAAVMSPESLITDAGSVKEPICEALRDLASGPVTFIGSHPLAGSEKQGYEFASSKLFDQRLCVITPRANSAATEVRRLHRFWQSVGMQTRNLPPDKHDAILAVTSHLPHALAALLAGMLDPENIPFAASGFRDTTRIAAGDPELWTAILLQNSAAVMQALTQWDQQFADFRNAVKHGDAASLKKLLQQAKTKRDALDQSPPSPGTD